MRHLGDITKIDGRSAPIVDVIIGGSPCQDLSVAGKRAGLQGERSGLFMEQIRIIKEMRQQSEICADEFIRPRYFVWENVPGAFSSNGREEYIQGKDSCLPKEIEHIYPDYSLYKELTKNTAYGFLTRGCPNDCAFCIVSKKEGRKSVKAADLSEFWRGQKYIKLLDPNLLACKERIDLLDQLIGSKAQVDFTQGLDARFITEEIAVKLKKVRCKMVHFAFDFMKNEKAILEGLRIYKNICEPREWEASVYMLTNFDTSIEEDLYRARKIQECGYRPDVRIYRKNTAPKVLRDMARWCNRREIYSSCDFMDYIPRSDGKTIKQLYFGG